MRQHIPATGIYETPAGGNVFGGASNRNGFRWDEQCAVPVPKASVRPRKSVARGGSLAARGKRVYSGCGNRRGNFVSKPFSIDQIFTSKVLERTFEMFYQSSGSFSCFVIC